MSQGGSSLYANSSDRVFAVCIGDPAGIGPEISLRVADELRLAAEDDSVSATSDVVLLFGDVAVLQRVGAVIGVAVPDCVGRAVYQSEDECWSFDWEKDLAGLRPGIVHVESSVADSNMDQVSPGCVNAQTGRRSFEFVCAAIDAAKPRGSGELPIADAIVTAPIQKEAWNDAGVPFMGHTELLASRCVPNGDPPADVRMVLASDELACVLETIHVGLADVPGLLSMDRLANTIIMAAEFAERRRRFLSKEGPITLGICGLNPHAGENGLIGHGEEQRVIEPAMRQAARAGLRLVGPLPPDTAFLPSMRSQVDAYVCLYHDQGLIPLKTLSFDEGVNVTLGLPVVRTSVDHGTALELAWRGEARCDSMRAAVQMARQLTAMPLAGEERTR